MGFRRKDGNKKVSRVIVTALLYLAAAYLGVGGLLYAFQDRMLYHPTDSLIMTPAQRGWTYEDVTLHTDDGERLHGWWIPEESERAVLLFLHGNAGNISGRVQALEPFRRIGLSVFLFDYRGYGKSTGRPSEEGLYRDAEAAWQYLTEERGYTADQIVVLGRSLGGGVATWLAEKHPPAALLLEATFTSVPDAAKERYPIFPVHLLARNHFNNLDRIRRIDAPVLVIHSPDDDVVSYRHGLRLYEAAGEPKSFLETEGLHHNAYLVTGKIYRAGIEAFLERHI